jgi:hypothetical protein
MVIFIASGTPFWKPSECPSPPSTSSLRGSNASAAAAPLSPRERDLLRLPLAVVANSSSLLLEHLPFFEAADNLLDHYEGVIAPSVQVGPSLSASSLSPLCLSHLYGLRVSTKPSPLIAAVGPMGRPSAPRPRGKARPGTLACSDTNTAPTR